MSHEEIFQSWLNSSLISSEEKQELLSLSEKDKQERFSDRPYSFGTSGIRALTGLGTQRLNRFTYRLIGKTYANYLKRKYSDPSILMVHDNRYEGQKYSIEIASVLKSLGIKVFLTPNTGSLSTPILSYLIRRKKLNGGISITASHNPINYNGLKIFNSLGKQLNVEEEREFYAELLPLKQAIEMDINPLNKSDFEIINEQEIDNYLTSLKKIISSGDQKKNIPVLFSSFKGTTQGIMEKFAHMLNFPFFKEYIQERNDLINPEDPASFQELSEQAEKENIHYIMCADLDGDRAAIAEFQPNKNWYFFNGNEIGVMLAHFKSTVQDTSNSYIVSTYVTNTLINKLFPNIPVFLSKTGFKHISEIVEKEENKGGNLLIAFEEACGVLMHPMHREKDSYQQIGYILEMINYLHSRNKTMKDYLEELKKTSIGYWKGWTDYYLVSKEKIGIFISRDEAQQILGSFPIALTNIIQDKEIITWNLENRSWIKFRYSGTEPKMKIYYNLFHRDKKELEQWSEKIRCEFNRLIQE